MARFSFSSELPFAAEVLTERLGHERFGERWAPGLHPRLNRFLANGALERRIIPLDDERALLQESLRSARRVPERALLQGYFRSRHLRLAHQLSLLATLDGSRPLRLAFSGASGLIGKAAMSLLSGGGHEIRCLKRSEPVGEKESLWDPEGGLITPDFLEGLDAVIHLGGANIGAKRWTGARKSQLAASRLTSTTLLAQTLAKLGEAPPLFICASAIGYFGNRGDEEVDEDSPPGAGFLPDLVRDWELACDAARQVGIRVVNLRSGLVLSAAGGALPRLLTPFKLGLGGALGDGEAYMSWITLDDLLGILIHALGDTVLSGPVNAVSPTPLKNRDFTRILARVLGRPAFWPLPAPLLRLLLGEMAQPLLLDSTRARPARLLEGGFAFRYPELEDALHMELGLWDRSLPGEAIQQT